MDATRGPILFRCDGTPEGSWEPLYQCLSLAAALQRRRRGTQFFSYLDPLSLATGINRANNDWTPAEQPIGSAGDIEATRALMRKSNAAAVVVAGEGYTEEYLSALKDTGVLVVVFDTTAKLTFPVDVVVNPFLAPGKKPYKVGPGCQRLLGHRYALCRGVFRRQRTIRATEPLPPFRALVAFGDDDAAGDGLTRTRQLLEMEKVQKITVALRTHHPRYDEIRDLADESSSRVEIVTETKELLTRLVRVHFALTSGDMWGPELSVVGIPQLVLSQTVRHGMNGKKMDEEGVATFLGDTKDVSAEQLKEAVDLLLEDPIERKGMSRCGRNLFDGRGPDRIVNGMEIMLHSPARRKTAVSLPANPLKIAA
jgi:spore coat polysaccharide biosynthesis predicted glycosyltransferase SpsG